VTGLPATIASGLDAGTGFAPAGAAVGAAAGDWARTWLAAVMKSIGMTSATPQRATLTLRRFIGAPCRMRRFKARGGAV
jgi:hypothetical protein